MSEKKSRFITVFIPTYNGAGNIAETIDAVLNQELPPGYELEFLIIDSGSSDNTLDIIDGYSHKVWLEQIPNSEFSHGGTRSKAAHMAKGEFILFLTQDATPTNYRWVINMIEPFFISEKVGCVLGRQVPRPNAAPTIKREISSVFGPLGAADSIVIHRNKSLVDGKKLNSSNNFFSDVNSAARRDLLIGDVPFRNVNYAEDQSLAEDMQKKGYLKVYAPLGEVWHSNDYTAPQYFHRKFDEYVGLHESTGYNLIASKRSLLLGWIRPTLADWRFIIKDQDYGFKSKLVWFTETPFYNIGLKAGQYFAAKSLKNPKVREKYSLEKKNRS
jgi:rhamnosyltransferase